MPAERGAGYDSTVLRLPLAQAFDDDALAQGEVARAQARYIECLHHAFEYLPTRDDDLRALRTDARHCAPLRHVERSELCVQTFEPAQDDLRARRLRALHLLRAVLTQPQDFA